MIILDSQTNPQPDIQETVTQVFDRKHFHIKILTKWRVFKMLL